MLMSSPSCFYSSCVAWARISGLQYDGGRGVTCEPVRTKRSKDRKLGASSST
jgi:hypothetical protein